MKCLHKAVLTWPLKVTAQRPIIPAALAAKRKSSAAPAVSQSAVLSSKFTVASTKAVQAEPHYAHHVDKRNTSTVKRAAVETSSSQWQFEPQVADEYNPLKPNEYEVYCEVQTHPIGW